MSNTQYSTIAVAAPQRFEYWKEVVLRHCIPAASKPLSHCDFDGQLKVHGVGLLDICTLSAPLHYWERTPRHLRTGPNDDLWLGFTRHGHGQLEQGGRRAALAANSLVLYDASQTFRFSLGGTDNHLVRIPRHLLSTRLPGVENLTAVVLDDRRPGVVPLREMLYQVAVEPIGLHDDDISGRFSQTLLDLLVLSLELQDLAKNSIERDLYARMMNYIRRHLTEPDLNIERIAGAHHVSSRTVTRAFARHQKTPMSVIWHERLQASRDAIERGNVRSISQAALDFGFSDFSHFSHAFRKAFGVTPHSLLKR
ncbi:helix-turn-helix domain-containing protein [Brenneria izbisi]|uniref:Helix-turn-helix domain-containing protein n=1 Tax=Brenneria izbisi TaxID=2939450 RepID=A0AA42C6E9_9GAMM|nr:helix-turn-helix domain-containing protein [Brenneria izbisi]MCV9880236.1 helix-turn-helix domain-containing protein [Brenneria izbisi]MCV9883658.1 helix-turn-helix domain-containing protein [Brenneria izbisi]